MELLSNAAHFPTRLLSLNICMSSPPRQQQPPLKSSSTMFISLPANSNVSMLMLLIWRDQTHLFLLRAVGTDAAIDGERQIL